MPSLLRIAAAATAAAAALAVPRLAHAEDHPITGNVTLGGDNKTLVYDTVTVKAGAVVKVAPYVMGGASGWLRIQANKIVVEAGATITADGAGFPGALGMNGQCQMGTTGCGSAGVASGNPGSGGGYLTAGSNGWFEMPALTCKDEGASSPGGGAFFDMTSKMLALGSAGGAAHVPMGSVGAIGGAGGGGIQLQAAVIQIDGTLSANGADGLTGSAVASGGGSGGSIDILAAQLSGMGTLSVKGGNGLSAAGITGTYPPNDGGGGGAGVILLHLPMNAPMSSLTFLTTGGKSGNCTGAADGTVVDDVMTKNCVDLDGDGHDSILCGGDDCDDSNPNVHPGATEVCNNVDDDCNMKIDDKTTDCPAMEVCMAGKCVVASEMDGGADGGEDAGPGSPADHLEFSGGIGCHVPDGLPEHGAAALLVGLGVVALGARRRRR